MRIQLAILGALMLLSVPVHGEKETAFLGVSTRPVDKTTRVQLDLPEGMGLVVSGIVPGSPAEGVMKMEDILTKLNQQLLVNPEQLGVLVKSFKPGDKVQIELIRKSKNQAVEVLLGQRPTDMVEDIEFPSNIQILGPTIKAFSLGGDNLMKGGMLDAEALNKLIADQLKQVEGLKGNMTSEQISNIMDNIDIGSIIKQATNNAANSSVSISAVISSVMVDENSGATLSYTQSGDSATLKITDKNGEKVFDGPVSTDEEKARIPEKYRKTFDELFKIQEKPWGEGAVINSFGGGKGKCSIKVETTTH